MKFCLSFMTLFLAALPALFGQDTIALRNTPLAFTPQQLVAPAMLLTAGLVTDNNLKYDIADWRNQHLSSFQTNADDFMAISPIIIAYGLDFAGLKARHDFMNRSAILFKGELMMLGSVYLLKAGTRQPRPDGSDLHSFPSSHTAQAFLAATFLSQEYKDRLPWIPYAAYAVASSVGMMRMANNRHYISDVLVGAGLGILSQKVSYWMHRYRWGRKVSKREVYHL